jgi:hypothetical protein
VRITTDEDGSIGGVVQKKKSSGLPGNTRGIGIKDDGVPGVGVL